MDRIHSTTGICRECHGLYLLDGNKIRKHYRDVWVKGSSKDKKRKCLGSEQPPSQETLDEFNQALRQS